MYYKIPVKAIIHNILAGENVMDNLWWWLPRADGQFD